MNIGLSRALMTREQSKLRDLRRDPIREYPRNSLRYASMTLRRTPSDKLPPPKKLLPSRDDTYSTITRDYTLTTVRILLRCVLIKGLERALSALWALCRSPHSCEKRILIKRPKTVITRRSVLGLIFSRDLKTNLLIRLPNPELKGELTAIE